MLQSAIQKALGPYADGVSVILFDSVDSTNTAAKRDPLRDTPTLYIARTQTAGRGRLGRSFHSPAATGLYMTLAYTTAAPLYEAVGVTAAAAVAAATAIESVTDKRVAIKWVNDLYLEGKKVGGILTEAVTRPDGRHRMAVGLGINLTTTHFPDGLRAPATCLFSEAEAASLPEDFAGRLAGEITRRLLELIRDPANGTGEASCLSQYRERLLFCGEEVVCTRGDTVYRGILQGVDDACSLILQTPDGEVVLPSGELSLRPAPKE